MKTLNTKDRKLLEVSTSDLFFSQLQEQYEIMYVLWTSLNEKENETGESK